MLWLGAHEPATWQTSPPTSLPQCCPFSRCLATWRLARARVCKAFEAAVEQALPFRCKHMIGRQPPDGAPIDITLTQQLLWAERVDLCATTAAVAGCSHSVTPLSLIPTLSCSRAAARKVMRRRGTILVRLGTAQTR
jgi:hypothetical protein